MRLFLIFLFLNILCLYSQDDSLKRQTFYHENGVVSSEGYFKGTMPFGVWKNYYENGILRSVGKRFLDKPDSTWLFYNDLGVLINQVFYKQGIKDSLEYKYSSDGFLISKELFKDGKKNGFSYYYRDQKMYLKSFYQEDVLQGYSYEFNKSGDIILISNYINGFIKTRDPVNRLNLDEQKQGKWISFYPCPEPCNTHFKVQSEGRYFDGLKHGYFKEYDIKGDIISTLLYRNDSLIEDESLQTIDVLVDYYSNAKVKSRRGSKNGLWQGQSVFYNDSGKIIKAEVYKDGILLAQGGVLDSLGLKHGFWKHFFQDGSLQSEGEYKHGLKYSSWSYFHPNKQLAQKGSYVAQEKPHGKWVWYYLNGQVQRMESFKYGVEDGEIIEYNDTNQIITQGQFMEGQKEGVWVVISGDYKEEGEYALDEPTGEWKQYYVSSGQEMFKGNFSDGIPIGKHTWLYSNGKKMLEGSFEAGERHGEWLRYNEQGLLVLTTYYQEGNQIKWNGSTIKPKNVDDFDIDRYPIMDKVK